MKGYQRATKVQEAGSLADVDRTDTPPHRSMHGTNDEGTSWCLQGRRSYQLTDDPNKVTCKRCLKLMGKVGP